MQSVVQERQRAAREREESETNSREEVDSFRAKEHAIKDNNQAIMRWVPHNHCNVLPIIIAVCVFKGKQAYVPGTKSIFMVVY